MRKRSSAKQNGFVPRIDPFYALAGAKKERLDVFMDIISTLINGLCLGAVYATIALGYTMVYGIAKMLNFAHGDVIMIGAYAIFFVMSHTNNPWLAIIISIIFCSLLGIIIERVAYKPLRGASSLSVLITAIGVSYMLQSLAQLIFDVTPIPVSLFNDLSPITLGGITIKMKSVITLIAGAIIMVALYLFINRSKTGRAMLAVSEDKGAAQLMGVNVNRTIAITFAIGSALAAVASVFYLFMTPVTQPTLGAMPGIKAFVAAVLGGIGSIPGAMVGGILIGIIEQFAIKYDAVSSYADALVFGILVIVLLVKPTGILGKKRNEKV